MDPAERGIFISGFCNSQQLLKAPECWPPHLLPNDSAHILAGGSHSVQRWSAGRNQSGTDLTEWVEISIQSREQLIGSRHLIPPGLPRAKPLPNTSCPGCSLQKTRVRNWAALSFMCSWAVTMIASVATGKHSVPTLAWCGSNPCSCGTCTKHEARVYCKPKRSSLCWMFTTDLWWFLEKLREGNREVLYPQGVQR